jgi:putative hydrolase of the HAD superfamily
MPLRSVVVAVCRFSGRDSRRRAVAVALRVLLRMKIEGVVFDFGGVMSTCATPVRVKEITDARSLPWQAVVDGFSKYRRLYDLGEISVGEFYDRLWRDAGVEVSAGDRLLIEEADTASFLYGNQKVLDWMRSLKSEGYKLGILTNMPNELAPRFKEHFSDIIAEADALVISCEERLVKPMREIYDLTAQRLGVDASRICFFDDSEMNCRGARDARWQAVRFESLDSAVADFERMIQS